MVRLRRGSPPPLAEARGALVVTRGRTTTAETMEARGGLGWKARRSSTVRGSRSKPVVPGPLWAPVTVWWKVLRGGPVDRPATASRAILLELSRSHFFANNPILG